MLWIPGVQSIEDNNNNNNCNIWIDITENENCKVEESENSCRLVNETNNAVTVVPGIYIKINVVIFLTFFIAGLINRVGMHHIDAVLDHVDASALSAIVLALVQLIQQTIGQIIQTKKSI
jgi:hypothetical protein